jgi:hypothetical protein
MMDSRSSRWFNDVGWYWYRYFLSNYSRDPGIVTTLLEQLELQPLSTRRKIARITLLHKAIHEKGVGPSQSVEYVFGDEGPKRCWHTQGEVGQAQGMLVSLPPLDMILHFYV